MFCNIKCITGIIIIIINMNNNKKSIKKLFFSFPMEMCTVVDLTKFLIPCLYAGNKRFTLKNAKVSQLVGENSL